MPMPIRPVNQTGSTLPSAMTDGRGIGLFGLQNSPMQQMLKQELERRDSREVVAEKKQGVDPRDVELIHKIWMDQPDDKSVITSASEAKGMVSLQVPNGANSYDLMRLKTNGLAIGNGDTITLTKKGQKVLKDKILATPSAFWLNRTKDGFDMKAAKPSGKLIRIADRKTEAYIMDGKHVPSRPITPIDELSDDAMVEVSHFLETYPGLCLSMRKEMGTSLWDTVIFLSKNPRLVNDYMERMDRIQKLEENYASQISGSYGTAGDVGMNMYLREMQREKRQRANEGLLEAQGSKSSLQKAVRTAQGLATPPYSHAGNPDPMKWPQRESYPDEPSDRIKPNPPSFRDWYNKELQPGEDKNVDARDRYVRQHAKGWLDRYFRPWAAKEYYDKALQYSPGEYPYLPDEKELELEEGLNQDQEKYEKWQRSPERKRFQEIPYPTTWGQSVMAANEAARVALAEDDKSNDCPDCKGTGQYPGGYRKRTQQCFSCSGTGKI